MIIVFTRHYPAETIQHFIQKQRRRRHGVLPVVVGVQIKDKSDSATRTDAQAIVSSNVSVKNGTSEAFLSSNTHI